MNKFVVGLLILLAGANTLNAQLLAPLPDSFQVYTPKIQFFKTLASVPGEEYVFYSENDTLERSIFIKVHEQSSGPTRAWLVVQTGNKFKACMLPDTIAALPGLKFRVSLFENTFNRNIIILDYGFSSIISPVVNYYIQLWDLDKMQQLMRTEYLYVEEINEKIDCADTLKHKDTYYTNVGENYDTACYYRDGKCDIYDLEFKKDLVIFTKAPMCVSGGLEHTPNQGKPGRYVYTFTTHGFMKTN